MLFPSPFPTVERLGVRMEKELTDEDVAYLRQSSWEKGAPILRKQSNPKFHRSFEENMAIGRFYAANEEYIRKIRERHMAAAFI